MTSSTPGTIPPPGRPVFVLHEHHKPAHHFDLRLEEDGVLKSWAVPRGLPTDYRHDRLAVQVDDHDLDHATYTDEHKDIADTGWWELEDRTEKRFVFVLHGRSGSHRYAMITTDPDTQDRLLHLVKKQPPS
jgi:DNA ligase D-like protein (predicted 3'-phosphoesterase)